jgi:sugar/nucleoside kinase (ribokinase family)
MTRAVSQAHFFNGIAGGKNVLVAGSLLFIDPKPAGASKLESSLTRELIIWFNASGLAHALHNLGPQKVVITDGPNGSYASYDFKLVTIPNYPDPAPPVDRTGAGDAFASTIVAALALGESMDTALTWAPINSASVVQKLGAQAGLLHREEVDQLLADAPEWYKLTDFEG